MPRQRQYRFGGHGVVVAVLDPAVTNQDESPFPALELRWRGKSQDELVAGIHDYVAIVHRSQQFANVAKAGVKAFQVTPTLLPAHEFGIDG